MSRMALDIATQPLAGWRLGRRGRFALLGLMVAIAFLASIRLGAVSVAGADIAGALLSPLGITVPGADAGMVEVLKIIRLPRAVLALFVGGGLAVAGAALQGLFRNPLADPGLIGVSSGSGLAAALVIILGGSFTFLLPPAIRPVILPLAAFAGGCIATVLVFLLGTRRGASSVALILLAGVAVGAICQTGIGLLTYMSTDNQLRTFAFWSMGSLAGGSWMGMAPALVLIAVGVTVLARQASALNAFLLGEAEAWHVGIDVTRLKHVTIIMSALVVGACVAVSGGIGFVGLVVPHLVRMMFGPDHRTLIPASGLLGAALLSCADIIARLAVIPAELPIGIVTTLVGGPFFIWLLLGQRRKMF